MLLCARHRVLRTALWLTLQPEVVQQTLESGDACLFCCYQSRVAVVHSTVSFFSSGIHQSVSLWANNLSPETIKIGWTPQMSCGRDDIEFGCRRRESTFS